jgi:hypothetical protein
MAFPGSIYAPPGVYTQTNFESPVQGLAANLRVPVFIGTGNEVLSQSNLEVVRGSSASVDQRVVEEDETGRAVVSITPSGAVTLGAFNGTYDRVQVRHFPIVTGNGTGTTATDTSAVNVTVNGIPVVVLSMNAALGVLKLSVAPAATDDVRVTYYFDRTDTQIMDDLSEQVTPETPVLYGAVGQNYTITAGSNDTLLFTVDSTAEVSVTLSASPSGGWTAAQVAAFVNSAATGTSLVAGTATNNFGQVVLTLTADRDVEVGNGTANTTLGFSFGTTTARNKVFYTFQQPIVDGTGGGVTTTDPSDVTVKVDGVQVIPTAVDGQSGAVTLPFAPEVGATVTVQYYFNSWQDTFDYLANRNITDIVLCGVAPDRSDYVDGTDFVLQDDKIVWGTAALVASGTHTAGATFLNETQVTPTLVDVRQYLAPCATVSATTFTLPLQPTTGNGRDTPLGTATFNKVANGRIDLPTNRPDLVYAYWGYSVQDALDRGRVTVTKVDSATSTITLSEPVPTGATVYATFYYNTIVDQAYTLTSVTPGPSGVGTYTVANADGTLLVTPTSGSKSAGLATIELVFPSGSESLPDFRYETPFDADLLTGAVEEDVTVTFATKDATLAKYAVPSSGPYYAVSGSSDRFRLKVDGSDLVSGAGGLNLSRPLAGVSGLGFPAQLVGNEVVYDAASGGATFAIDATNNTVNMEVDGVLVQAVADDNASGTLDDFALALNRAATGEVGVAQAGGASSITLAATASSQDSYYVGWKVHVTAGAAIGDIRTVTAYNGTTKVATVDSAWTGAPVVTDTYSLYNEDTLPQYAASTAFTSPVVVTLNEYDQLRFVYTGDNSASLGTLTATVAPGTYTSAATLAAAVQTALDNAIAAAPPAAYGAFSVVVSANTSGKLVFSLVRDPTDTEGYLEFVTNGTAARDFAVLAGISTASAAGGAQAKLVNGSIARRFTVGSAPLLYDRLVLRSRLVPGSGSVDGQGVLATTQLKQLGGTGAVLTGLVANENALAGLKGTIMPATLLGTVGLASGQVAAGTYGDARDGQPVVTFFAAGGTSAQNNEFKFTFDHVPVTVVFTDAVGAAIPSGGSADVPLGPASVANTVLNQVAAAMASVGLGTSAAAVVSAGLVRQEGAAIRFRSALSTTTSGLVVGTANANDTLGFGAGDSAERTALQVEVLVSALMAHFDSTVANTLLNWASGGASAYFAGEALAKRVTDSSNAEYLYLQSLGNAGLGAASSVEFATATSASVTLPGVGLGVTAGDGAEGEAAVSGFYVTSTDVVSGSGTANTSYLNSGVGQDGVVGQTYRDLVTGLTFTVLPRAGNLAYPSGQSFTIIARKTVTTDANTPVNTLPGVSLVVSNTLGVPAGDTATVTTYARSGAQPAVGDVYYVSYTYTKQDYNTALYTKLSAIEAAYGPNSPLNPVVLASYLAILNGAVLVGIKQVQKDTDADNNGTFDTASEAAFIAALDDLEGALPGGLLPDILVPLKGDSVNLFQYLARQCDIQSSIRYRAERTGVVGFSAGTAPTAAGNAAVAVGRTRLRCVYPDIANLTLSRADGTTDTYLVDGTFLAAALVGSLVSPTTDVATPWTGRRLFGFDRLARVLDAVQQNQVAVKGVTVLEDRNPVIRVRQGLSTDMTNVLTRTPTVITIADEVQQQTRATLDRFIGIKFLPGVTSQIEGQVSNTLKQLVAAQIITAYTGVKAKVSEDDPTVAEVEAAYQPVFPLLYIVVSFSMRSSL